MDAAEMDWWAEEKRMPPPACARPPTSRYRPGDVLIQIDSRFVGKIIGKGGVTIRGLKQRSGAFISVIDSVANGMKTVKISGSPGAKRKAEKLVRELINSRKKRRENLRALEEVMKRVSDLSIENVDRNDLVKEHEENVERALAALPPIVKNFYQEHPEVSALSDQQVVDFRLSKNNIMVTYTGENNNLAIPKPVWKFYHAFKDYPEIMKELQKQNFEEPSPVQCQAWPIIMSGHDLIAIAQTGTGKTLAFLLPAFIHIDCQWTPRKLRKGPTVLVLAPTRELVLQIENEVKKYNYKGIKSMSIYGGASSEKQKKRLLKGVEIVIATPGRLNDFVKRGFIDLSGVSYLVLDEADRMLNLGFEPQISLLSLKLRTDRQTVMTSATWPSGVNQLTESYPNNFIQIMVGSLDLTTVNSVIQNILIMEQKEKEPWLCNFLKNITKNNKVIVFLNRKVNVDLLSESLCIQGFDVASIHGGRVQSDREMALDKLRNGAVNILIATDVASRGINIDDVTIIINYELAKDIEEYVHRVGRAGRAGKTGLAITLMTKYDEGKSKDLIKLMEKSGQIVPPELYYMAKKFGSKQNKKKEEGSNTPFRGRGFSRGIGSFSRY